MKRDFINAKLEFLSRLNFEILTKLPVKNLTANLSFLIALDRNGGDFFACDGGFFMKLWFGL